MVEQYQYQRIKSNQIRLLELQDHPDPQRLIRRILTVPRHDCPLYTAISYVWGASEQIPLVGLICDDPESKLTVTKNLESALRSVVRNKARLAATESQSNAHEQSLFVWADAISINQSDLEEKGAQVGMMQDVYQRALRVHIWLGDEAEDTKLAFDLINRLSSQVQLEQSSDQKSTSMVQPAYGLVALLKRPWFTRIWIVQEVAAAQRAEVFCGDHSVDWEHLVEAGRNSLTEQELLLGDIKGREQLLRIARTRGEFQARIRKHHWGDVNQNLQRLLLRHHTSSSTVPHDMVYALQGVCGLPTIYEKHQMLIKTFLERDLPSMVDMDQITEQVDYKKSMEEVYTQTAVEILSKCQTLDLLGACAWSRQAVSLPSWVPDWSTAGTYSIPADNFEPSYKKPVRLEIPTGNEISKVQFFDEDGENAPDCDWDIIRYIGLSGYDIGTIETTLPREEYTLPRDLHYNATGVQYWQIATTGGSNVYEGDANTWDVPNVAEAGDIVSLAKGAKVPLILRESTEDIDRTNAGDHKIRIYKLIGECHPLKVSLKPSLFDFTKYSPFWLS